MALFTTSPCAPAQGDSVTVSAGEFQRMVYSAHLLTQMDAKPELDASLQVLLELQRRNPNAAPAVLADLLCQSLVGYRTNTPSCVKTFGYRDEILAAYLEALRQVPARTNFVHANLTLLNSFLLQPRDYTNASAAELIHSGNQRLLRAEQGAAQRETLVEVCMRRGQEDHAFAQALDALLGPETGVLHSHTVAQILSANSALSNRPTMQEMVYRSSISGDGSVTLSTNDLKNLFALEMATMHEIINTNRALNLEIIATQSDLASYLTNAALVQANLERETVVRQGQAQRLAAAGAAVNQVSRLTASKLPALGQAMGGLGRGVKSIADGLRALSEAGKFATALSCGNFLAGGLQIVGSILDIAGVFQDPNDVILKEIDDVKTLVNDLSTNMNYRFDRVDASLNQVLDQLAHSIALIGQVGHSVEEVRRGLLDVQTDLHRLERHLLSYLSELDGRHFKEVLNLYLGYENKYGTPMSYNSLPVPYYVYGDNAFYTYAYDTAADEGCGPYSDRDYSAAGLFYELTESSVSGVTNRLDQNLCYLKKYLQEQLGQPTAGMLGHLVNPRDWFMGAYAYLQLAAENPIYFRRVTPGAGVDLITGRGQELMDFLRSLTFTGPGTNFNLSLYYTLLTNYSAKLDSFVSEVDRTETAYASFNHFALDTWREWSAVAPRVTAASSELLVSDPDVPLVCLPNPVIGIAAGRYHNLALRTNGTVVAWGANNRGQALVGRSVSNVIAVAANGDHSLALRRDGSIICWGDIASAPATATNAVAVAAGWSHGLALRADGTVVAWGDIANSIIPGSATNIVALAGGGRHSLALRGDGTVVAWGWNDFYQTNVPPSATSVIAIAAGGYSSLALRADHTVVSWGDGPLPPVGLTNVVAIAAGGIHHLALKVDGTVVGWGFNYDGQIDIPAALSNVVAIAAGDNHSLALKADGTVVVWGGNNSGQRIVPSLLTWQRGLSAGGANQVVAVRNGATLAWGPGDWGTVNVPASATNVIAVTAGYLDNVAVRADGTVVSWGYGAFGVGSPPANVTNVVAVSPGYAFMIALRADRTVVGWGYNGDGQLNMPAGVTNVVAIAAGDDHSLALRGDGSVVGWGVNQYGQITIPSAALNNVVGIAAGADASLAVKADGTVIGWGDGSHGHLNIPASATNVVAIAAGWYCCLALRADGTVVGWGNNGYVPPNLGKVVAIASGWGVSVAARADGSVVGWNATSTWDWRVGQTDVPQPPPRDVIGVAAGQCHSLVLQADGSAVAFGTNSYGQCTIPAVATNLVAIAAGSWHNLALRADGTVVGWGNNGSGEAAPPSGATDVVAVSAGGTHSLALKRNGTVLAWGANSSGQTTVPALSNVVAIAAGGSHSLALKADSTIVGWGNNGYGQASATGLSNVVAIAAGPWHSLALLANGQVVAWGLNNYGHQTEVPPAAQSDVVAIAAGQFHNLALKRDGTVVSWGGQGASLFTVPAGLSNVVAIAAGGWHSLFVTANPMPAKYTAPATSFHISSCGASNGVVRLGWQSCAGNRYQVQYKDSLGSTNWSDLALLTATGPTATATSAAGSSPQRFYRVIQREPWSAPFVAAQVPDRVGYLLADAGGDVITNLSAVGKLRTASEELSGAKALLTSVLELALPYTMQRDDALHGFLYGSEALADLEVTKQLFAAQRAQLQSTPNAPPLVLENVAWPRLTSFEGRLTERLNDLAASGQPESPRLVGHTLRLLNLLRDAWTPSPPPTLEMWQETASPWLILYGEPYAHYTLQCRDSLDPPGWSSTAITNLHNQQPIVPPVSGSPSRFYRAVMPAP